MKIEIEGDAFRLLDHFIYFATGKHSEALAAAMYFDPDTFRARAQMLEDAVHRAMEDHPCPE